MQHSLRKTAKLVNVEKNRLRRAFKHLSVELLELNISLALQAPHYHPFYSLYELGLLLGLEARYTSSSAANYRRIKYQALQVVLKCQVPLYQMGHKRIVLLSDLHKLHMDGY